MHRRCCIFVCGCRACPSDLSDPGRKGAEFVGALSCYRERNVPLRADQASRLLGKPDLLSRGVPRKRVYRHAECCNGVRQFLVEDPENVQRLSIALRVA